MRGTSGEDPLTIYRPFLDELSRLLQKVGETATLQEYARNPEKVRLLEFVFMLMHFMTYMTHPSYRLNN